MEPVIANLFGHNYSRRELLDLVDDMSQAAGRHKAEAWMGSSGVRT